MAADERPLPGPPPHGAAFPPAGWAPWGPWPAPPPAPRPPAHAPPPHAAPPPPQQYASAGPAGPPGLPHAAWGPPAPPPAPEPPPAPPSHPPPWASWGAAAYGAPPPAAPPGYGPPHMPGYGAPGPPITGLQRAHEAWGQPALAPQAAPQGAPPTPWGQWPEGYRHHYGAGGPETVVAQPLPEPFRPPPQTAPPPPRWTAPAELPPPNPSYAATIDPPRDVPPRIEPPVAAPPPRSLAPSAALSYILDADPPAAAAAPPSLVSPSVASQPDSSPVSVPDYVLRTSRRSPDNDSPDEYGGGRRRKSAGKNALEKRRRDAFNSELHALSALIPGIGAHADTKIGVVLCAKDYIRQLQAREKALRALAAKQRAALKGLDPADETVLSSMLVEVDQLLSADPP
ncbi:hypothetical protein DFJ74DRAFT_640428 [Hyaloraphidium curvatum]|nr:hypothetical protein DFJ74DRAFT_640428 [Hyaloraphidium curvatum]